nr:hypothetical protein [Tanacetum cinerariifolium]
KNNSGNGEVNTASVPTASTQVSPASANVVAASISLDTACAYIASQYNGSQIKYEDINQIDEDDIEKMDINLKVGAATGSASDGKKGRTVVVTTEDMQKRRNDVKARTTLLLALPDEHQLRFSKYKTAQELWAAILKTFAKNNSGNGEVNTASVPTASTQVSPASANVMRHSARECRAPRSQERGRRENYRQGLKEEEQAPKALIAIDGVGWD